MKEAVEPAEEEDEEKRDVKKNSEEIVRQDGVQRCIDDEEENEKADQGQTEPFRHLVLAWTLARLPVELCGKLSFKFSLDALKARMAFQLVPAWRAQRAESVIRPAAVSVLPARITRESLCSELRSPPLESGWKRRT